MTATVLPAWRRAAAEPLVRFVVIGGLLFAAHAFVASRTEAARDRIEVTARDRERLRALSVAQWGREPDAAQMDALVTAFVREEVLYRTARAEGLDRDDLVVRRRLAQKMEFLAQADVSEPDEAALRAWYAAHASRYARDAAPGFEQIVFTADRRGEAAEDVARTALASLRSGAHPAGDPTLLPARLEHPTREEVDRDIEPGFAARVALLSPGVWEGPLETRYGMHLVRRLPASAPAGDDGFEAARDQVRADLMAERAAAAREAAYDTLRRRFTIVAPGLAANGSGRS